MYIQSDQDFQYYSLQQLARHSISGQQHNDLQLRNNSPHGTSQHSSSSLSSRPKKSKLKNFLFGGSGSSSTGYGSHGDINSSRNMNRGFPGSPSRSKRPLKCPILQAPDYLLDPHIFIESYVEVESQYLGILKDVQRNFPMGSRQTVLTTIDRAKQRGQLPYTYQPCDDVIISLSIHNIKILRRDSETLLLRVFLHEIDSIGMASDCAVTYVLLKVIPSTHAAKRSSDCRLVVLKFVSSAQADETCALFKQLFATLFSESAVRALTPPMKTPPQFLNGSSAQNTPMENSPAFQMLAPDSSRNSSIALETSVGSGPEMARFSRPTSILMPDIPKSSSLFYDSPPQYTHYSPVPRPDYFSPQLRVAYMNRNSPNIFSSPQQYHHQRAFSDAPHRDNALQSRINASSTPRRESSFIMNQNGSSPVQSDRKFLEDIHKMLTPDEVKQFNSIIYAYLFDNGSIDLFIRSLGALLGADRMHIMAQLGKFLPVLKESNQLHAMLSEQVSNMEGDVSPRGGGDGRATDGEVRSGNESSSLSSHSLNLNEQTPSGQRNGHKMPSSSAESHQRGGARSKEPSSRQKDISGVIENRKNVMSYCSSSSSSCSFSASNETTQQQLTGSNERTTRGKTKIHKPNEPSGKYYPNSVANAERKTSAGGITLNENGRVKPKKRTVEASEDKQNETDPNSDQIEIPQELLELDSMLAQMSMSSPPTTLAGGSNGLAKDSRTAKSDANSSDCENENKTLEAPTNTNSALSSNQNSSYTLNSSTYIKSSGSEKSAKNKPNKGEPGPKNNHQKPHEMKNSPPHHLKQMFEPPGNDL